MLLEFGHFLILRGSFLFPEILRVILTSMVDHSISFCYYPTILLIEKGLNWSCSLSEKLFRVVPKALRVFRLESSGRSLAIELDS